MHKNCKNHIAHIHPPTHTPTRTHLYTHTRTHARAHTHACVHTHTRMCAHTHTCTHAHTHTHTHPHAHAHTHAHTRAHACTHTHMHTCVHTRVHPITLASPGSENTTYSANWRTEQTLCQWQRTKSVLVEVTTLPLRSAASTPLGSGWQTHAVQSMT